MPHGTRSLLDRDLAKISDLVQQLTSRVLTALDQAMEALYERDVELAKEVVRNDEQVNQLRYEIEEECLRVLATQQPAAIDLRIVVAATHIAGELERIGDHAASIADVVDRMAGLGPIANLHKLPKMARHGRCMVEDSTRAFLEHDADLAYSITRREYKLDKHYSSLFHEAIHQMQDEPYVERATFLLWVGRHLERVGDRATNIAERVIFLTTGKFVEIQ
ncbi:MAG: phosphate signaling complex protein PhoU [Candidatus Promineifilaceae bacterium]|nr:phosphate signaling complex protein PhoU [Candidatus Promineifilaceae bacterium]